MAPQLPHSASAPTAVLSDVTNTTAGQPLHFQCGAAHQCVISKKPVTVRSDSGAPPQAVVPAVQSVATSWVSLFGPGDCAEASAAPSDCSEDPQQAAEYVADIFAVLHREEGKHMPHPNYMEQQPHINAKMRGILIDWLVDVHKKYKLKPETLYLTVSLVDRFLEKRPTARRFLQLVGVSALLIAAKFEELNPPQVHDFVYVTDNAYSREAVMRMEVSILTAVDFNICSPTPVPFLDRLQLLNGCDEVHVDLSRYLLELTVVEYKMVKYPPSHLAAAAILLSNKLLRQKPSWSSDAVEATGLTEQMLRECVFDIIGLLGGAESSSLQAVRKKYSHPAYHEVAKTAVMCEPHARTTLVEEHRARTASLARSAASEAGADELGIERE